MDPIEKSAKDRRTCCMKKDPKNGGMPPGMRIRICGAYCIDKISAKEILTARKQARLIVLDKWLAVDEWLDVMETAHRIDAMATNHGWKRLKRDPFNQIHADISDDFLLTVGHLHHELSGKAVDPLHAIAVLADTSEQIAGLWLFVAEQRGLLPTTTHERTHLDG